MWIFHLRDESFNVVKPHTHVVYYGFKDLWDVYSRSDANSMSDAGVLPAVQIAVESIPDTLKPRGLQEIVYLSQEARLQLRDSYGIAHY